MSLGSRWLTLTLISLSELLGMTLWFSASAVVPAMKAEWNLTDSGASWLTLAVQLGFVAGTFASALMNLPDIFSPRGLMATCAILGSAANASFSLFAGGPVSGIFLRFLTGLFLAGVYPPGMKLMSTWFRQGRGMAIGVLVGALTLGKASPYLVNGLGGDDWRTKVWIVSILGLTGGLIILFFVREGPFALPNARFDIHQARNVLTNRGVRLATFGYLGHMWELYAMWTWAPVMQEGGDRTPVSLIAMRREPGVVSARLESLDSVRI